MALSYRPASAYSQTPFRRRMSGLGFALGINLLILFAFLTLGVRLAPRKASEAIVVDMLPRSDDQASRRAETTARPKAATQPKPRKAAMPPPVVPPAVRDLESKPLDMLVLTPEEYAAADIGKLPKSADAGPAAGDSEEVGRGPHGQVLYAAEWAREPTDAELGGYLPRNAPEGYGLIACKTVPNNRVDDCVELSQSPPGSHLASAVRQAAWQFRVRPPRKNGRPMIGEWVRIRIDYVTGG